MQSVDACQTNNLIAKWATEGWRFGLLYAGCVWCVCVWGGEREFTVLGRWCLFSWRHGQGVDGLTVVLLDPLELLLPAFLAALVVVVLSTSRTAVPLRKTSPDSGYSGSYCSTSWRSGSLAGSGLWLLAAGCCCSSAMACEAAEPAEPFRKLN
jgi:hypothetical protein